MRNTQSNVEDDPQDDQGVLDSDDESYVYVDEMEEMDYKSAPDNFSMFT